jgi:hypothetical protein
MGKEGPPMIARPDDWKRLPFEEVVAIPYKAVFTRSQYETLAQGVIPEVMEDKWFAYLEDHSVFLHRSWTGQGVYRFRIEDDGESKVVVEAYCAASVVGTSSADYQAELLDFLVHVLLLREPKPFPRPAHLKEPAPGVYQHAVSGTGLPEVVVAPRPWWKFWN